MAEGRRRDVLIVLRGGARQGLLLPVGAAPELPSARGALPGAVSRAWPGGAGPLHLSRLQLCKEEVLVQRQCPHSLRHHSGYPFSPKMYSILLEPGLPPRLTTARPTPA